MRPNKDIVPLNQNFKNHWKSYDAPPRTVFISPSKEIATIPLMQSIHYTCNNNHNEFFWCLFQFMTTSLISSSILFMYPCLQILISITQWRCLVEHNHACVHYELMELHIKYCARAVVQVCHFFRFSNLIYLFIYVWRLVLGI